MAMAPSSRRRSPKDEDQDEALEEDENARPSASSQYTSEGPTAEQLLALSKYFMQIVMNDKDFEHPVLEYLTPDFISNQEGSPGTSSRDEFIDYRERMARVLPDIHQEVVNCAVEVNEHNGRAKIWLTLHASGIPDGLEREYVTVLYWRKRKATGWKCWKCSGLVTGGSAV